MTEALGFILIAAGLFVLFVLTARRQAPRDSPLKLTQPLPPPSKQDPVADVLVEIKRMGHAARAKETSDEQKRRWLRPFGVFGRLFTYAALFLTLYIFWPKDISKTPLAGLTLSDIGGTAVTIVICLLLIKALFSPSEDDDVRKAWGWLGVIIVVLMIGAFFYFQTHSI